MSILRADSVSVFFHESVTTVMRSRKVSATESATTYLVGLLADFAKPARAETMDRPLAFLLDEALHTEEIGERFERLRTLGDSILYTSGFFGDHFEARGVDQGYLIGMGQTAYKGAGSLLRAPSSRDVTEAARCDIFGELADGFAAFVAVIAEVADRTLAGGVGTSKGLLRLYERWLKTRSETLAVTLSSHGFVAPRGARVLS